MLIKSNELSLNIPVAFAGANTGMGFVSFYDSIFPEHQLEGLYIIKGGSGTGKSTFMRGLGEMALQKGYMIEHYLCGSDENSLDGIIINGTNGRKIGVIDGTPPHPREFRSPGAAGDILNFGMFWDSLRLRERRSEIDSIAKKKGLCYDTVYRYLGAAERINRHILSLADSFYLKEKGEAAAARLVHSIGEKGDINYLQLSGYTMNGVTDIRPSIHNLKEYAVVGEYGLSIKFMNNVAEFVITNGISALICRSPLDLRNIEGIIFPEKRVWLHITDDEENAEKIIRTKRFADIDKAAACRQRLRFGKKCKESLINGAMEALAEAKELHFLLEGIYKEYMDFSSLSEQSDKWYNEIFDRLDR